MGFRVRGNNGEGEQTLKTNGVVSGGLHKRMEYNVSLDNPARLRYLKPALGPKIGTWRQKTRVYLNSLALTLLAMPMWLVW